MAGKRARNGGYMDSQGINGYYWASSPNGTYGSILFFGSADIYTILGGYRAN
jgi:hypothetical protein